MKKIITLSLIFISLGSVRTYSQTVSVEGTIVNMGSDVVEVFGKPSTSAISGLNFLGINITISIADQGANNPTFASIAKASLIPNLNITPADSATDAPNAPTPYVISGRAYYSYLLNDNGNGVTTTWTANGNNPIASFTFPSDPSLLSVELNDQSGSGGGPNGQMYWYVSVISGTVSNGLGSAGDVTNYSTMFYGTGAINTGGVSNSDVPLQPISILPIKFLNFTAVADNNSSLLNWAVGNETSGSSYEVERSTDPSMANYTAIGTVPVTNPSALSNTYNYTDPNISSVVSSGILYYRIKQIDQSGSYTFSSIEGVEVATGGTAKAYPNPTKDFTTISFGLNLDKAIALDVVALDGKIVQHIEFLGIKGMNTQQVDLRQLSSGNYLLKLNLGTEVQTLSVVKTN